MPSLAKQHHHHKAEGNDKDNLVGIRIPSDGNGIPSEDRNTGEDSSWSEDGIEKPNDSTRNLKGKALQAE